MEESSFTSPSKIEIKIIKNCRAIATVHLLEELSLSSEGVGFAARMKEITTRQCPVSK